MTDREKLIELIEESDKRCYGAVCDGCPYHKDGEKCQSAMLADHLIANGVTVRITGETSDGYHTFNELYHHRAVLFSVICNTFPALAWKSKQHDDPALPMYEGMFIVGIQTPEGQATYHYDIDPYWDMFHVKELERAPVWDGHTPAEAIRRIGTLTTPEEDEHGQAAGGNRGHAVGGVPKERYMRRLQILAGNERDEYKKRCAELEELLAEKTKCSDCKHFIPRIWDCELYPGPHSPDGHCDQGERE